MIEQYNLKDWVLLFQNYPHQGHKGYTYMIHPEDDVQINSKIWIGTKYFLLSYVSQLYAYFTHML